MSLKRQTILFLSATAAVAAIPMGCSDDTSTPRQATASSSVSSSSGSMGEGGNGGNPTGGMGGNAGGMGGTGGVAGMGGSAGGTGGGGAFGTVELVDVADTPCTPLVGTVTSGAPAFNKLGKVGGKRFAGGRYVPGFSTFGLDGSSPSATVVGLDPDFDLVTSEGNTIGLATADGTNIRYQRYAADDTPIGSPVVLGDSLGSGVAIAGDNAGGSLVVWADDMVLNGRFVDSAGGPGAIFTFANGLPTKSIVTSLARNTTDFAIAWSTVDNGTARGRFARLTTTGLVGSIVELTGDAYSHYVVKLTPTPTGYALLVHSGVMTLDTIVVILDADGKIKPPARRFLGLKFGYDISANGNDLGLVAKRADGSAAFRLLDSAGVPSGAWKCLDAPSQDSYDQAGIDADGTGWAIVYRTPLGGEKFVRTNLMGTAAP
jgi:hypothetical protein